MFFKRKKKTRTVFWEVTKSYKNDQGARVIEFDNGEMFFKNPHSYVWRYLNDGSEFNNISIRKALGDLNYLELSGFDIVGKEVYVEVEID